MLSLRVLRKGYYRTFIVLAFSCGRAETIGIRHVWKRITKKKRTEVKISRFLQYLDTCWSGLSLVWKWEFLELENALLRELTVYMITFFSANEENSKVSFNLRPQRWSHEKGFHYIYHPNTSTQLSPPLLDSLQSAMSWPYQIQNCWSSVTCNGSDDVLKMISEETSLNPLSL